MTIWTMFTTETGADRLRSRSNENLRKYRKVWRSVALRHICRSIEHIVVASSAELVMLLHGFGEAAARRPRRMFDVIVVGGGPAGLSAALMLGRCRRRVLVCDLGEPRNRWSRALHGYLTRDGIDPPSLNELGRGELRAYRVAFRCLCATRPRPD